MLNKLQFNNMVISNKKGIQQARIQTINKLVHKIRKLKTLLEKRPADSKCMERVRKSTETMEHLKKIKRVDIMKSVLLLEKPAAAVITNGLSTPEEMAIALLAMNKVMQGLSKRFKIELKLVDAPDSKWRDELKENSKRRQKIERTEEKKRKRIAVKEQKAIARKRQEWLVQNCPNGQEGEDKEANVSTVSGWKIEEIEEPAVTKAVTDVVPKKPQQIKKPREGNRIENIRNEPPKKKQKSDIKSSQIKKFVEDSSSEKEDDNFRRNASADENDEEEPTNIQQPPSPHENVEESDTETHVVDPFFVTETGENYLSTAVRSRIQEQDDNNEENDQKDLHMIKLNGSKKHTNFRERKQHQLQSDRYAQKQNNYGDGRYPQKQNNWKEDKYPKKSNNWNTQSDVRSNGRDPRHQKNNIEEKSSNNRHQNVEQNLHPSWAAKQKLKPVITAFQGKKITFDDDDGMKMTNGNNSSMPNNRKDQPAHSTNTDSLHPSWAAKQKQKPVITAFQGKKISFNNDDE